jgi:hypothetical protein
MTPIDFFRNLLSDLKYRARALFRRRTLERDLDDELQFHLEREMDKLVRSGLPQAEAARRARQLFGGVERIKEESRDVRGIALVDEVGQNVRYALRSLRRAPAFAIAVVLSLALGIGANGTMFAILDAALLRRLPYDRPDELVAPALGNSGIVPDSYFLA